MVEWLTSLPFPVENLNTLLAGLGDTVEVVFAPGVPIPSRAELQPELESDLRRRRSSPASAPKKGCSKFGWAIIDPSACRYAATIERWKRLVALVEQVVIPRAKSSTVLRIVRGVTVKSVWLGLFFAAASALFVD